MEEKRFPSPFYRVSVKAIILKDNRLLVSQKKDGLWEIPGGGWEHDETLELAVERELEEELHAKIKSIGDVCFTWRDYHAGRDVHYLRLAVPVTLQDYNLVPDDGDLIDARFVNENEFMKLPFQAGEQGVRSCAHKIWST